MKKFIFFSAIALLALVTLGCEKEEKEEKNWTSLPPETQEGKNTIGCLIDGELWATNYWIDDKKFINPFSMYAHYKGPYFGPDKMIFCKISAIKKNQTSIKIFISTPNIQIMKPLKGIAFFNKNTEKRFISENPYIYLTRFDTINKIISGRFSFEALDIENKILDDTIKITNGRFDMKLRIK